MIKRRNGFTLVEILVVSAIMVIIIVAGFSLLKSGSKTAIKGGSYLANSMAAGNLARRLEMDIECSSKIDVVSQGSSGEMNFYFNRLNDGGRLETICVNYKWPAKNNEGIVRQVDTSESTVFCSNRAIALLKLSAHEFDSKSKKNGFQINLSVQSKSRNENSVDGLRELVNIKRFAFAHNSNIKFILPAFNYWGTVDNLY